MKVYCSRSLLPAITLITLRNLYQRLIHLHKTKVQCKRTQCCWPCDDSQHYGELLRPFACSKKFDLVLNFAQQLPTTRKNNRVYKRTQHVTSNNVVSWSNVASVCTGLYRLIVFNKLLYNL